MAIAAIVALALGTSTIWWFLLGLAVAIPFAVGWHDRWFSVALAAVLLYATRDLYASPGEVASWPIFESLLILHAFVPTAPFGSLAALGRTDPGGGWRLPERWFAVAWVVVAGCHFAVGLYNVLGETWRLNATTIEWIIAATQTLLPLLVLSRRLRPGLLLAMTGFVAWTVFGGWVPAAAGLLVIAAHLYLIDPAWLPARVAAETVPMYYDGDCGLCHRSVRFFLAEDPQGLILHYTPLHSAAFDADLTEAERESLPDSLVVRKASGELLVRSDAVLHALNLLGGYWRVAAALGSLLPRALRDPLYNAIARNRLRLFGKPEGACPLVPPRLSHRFVT